MYMGYNDGSALMKTSNFREKANAKANENQKIRTILHCDANSFFASCETAIHPEYASFPMAVCGSVEERHGIVLARNELAKKYGVTTAEPVWQAKKKCPQLLTVRPTYGLYSEMSEKMNKIFYDYTDKVEPFGIDESWLDVSGSFKLFGNGKSIADAIRERVKNELGITVSVGVSFNKVFAKLGSDMKKPNATTVIPRDRFASIVWPLPVTDLLFVGSSTAKVLNHVGIYTIGDLACCNESTVKKNLGKNGVMLREFARGNDFSEVTVSGYEPTPKSVSNGMTFRDNLKTSDDISFAITYLSMSVAERLRRHKLCCNNVAVTVRLPDLTSFSHSVSLAHPTCLYDEISKVALSLVYAKKAMWKEIYSVTVHAEKLTPEGDFGYQQKLFPEAWEKKYESRHSLETAVDSIRKRFGKNAVQIASAIDNRLV